MAEIDRAEITVDGDVSPFRRKLREAAAELNKFGRDGKGAVDGLGNAFGGLHSKAVGALTGILSLGAIGAFVKSTKDAAVEAEAAFRGLESVANYSGIGIGAAMQEAGKLAADGLITTAESSKALQNLLSRGYNIDQAMQTLMRLKDAAAFNRSAHLSLGEAVVTASEGLKNENSILVDNAGVTKNVSKMWQDYANQIGKTVNDLSQAEKIQAEYIGIMQETEAQVGNAAKATEGMQGQQARLAAETKNLQIAIGQGLTPAFTALARAGAWVINGFAKPIMWYFETLGIRAANLAQKIGIVWDAVTSFNFSGLNAKFDAANRLKEEMIEEVTKRFDSPMTGFEAGVDSGKRRPPESAESKKQKGGAKTAKEKAAPDSFMQYYEAALDQEKRLASERDALRGYTKQQELSFWQSILANADLRNKDRLAIERKVSGLIVEIRRDEAKQKMDLDAEAIRSNEALALGRVEAARTANQILLDQGQLTHSQFLKMEEEFEAQRYEIQRAALEERLKLLEQDPNTNPVEFARIKNEMLELEQQYQLQRLQLLGQQQQEEMVIWDSLSTRIGGLWDKGLQAMMNGTLTARNAIRAIWAELASWFAEAVVGKMVKEWITAEARKIAMKLGFVTQEKAIETAGAAATMATKATEATAVVSSNAAEAASGAAASQSSIPIVGPALAIAAFAAIMAMVLGAKSQIKSAAKGYDIPKGLNPMTQLHEEEMVLPAKYANVIRDIAGGSSAGGEGGGEIHIYARNDGDVVRTGDLKKLLRQMGRNFVEVRLK